MGGELFKKLRGNFEQVCRQIPDTRRPGHNLRYAVADFMKCAFDDLYSHEPFCRQDTFYNALRYTFSRFLHEDWSAFIVFIWGDEPDG
jgi:hypothetical protein